MTLILDFNVNMQNRNGETMLHVVLRNIQFDMIVAIDKILALGADCNIIDYSGR